MTSQDADVRWFVRLITQPTLRVNLQFELRDLWVGVFWRRNGRFFHLYICLLPTVALHVTILRPCDHEWIGLDGPAWCAKCGQGEFDERKAS